MREREIRSDYKERGHERHRKRKREKERARDGKRETERKSRKVGGREIKIEKD